MSIPPSPEDPLPGHRFLVSLDPADAFLPPAQAARIRTIAAGEFSDVTGLGAKLELLAYPEGGRNDYVHQLPVRHSYTNITLACGIVRDPVLFRWYEAGMTLSLGARRDGAITLLTPNGIRAVSWIFRAGLACGWKGPELKAGANAVAVESIEIAHQGLQRVSHPATPPRRAA